MGTPKISQASALRCDLKGSMHHPDVWRVAPERLGVDPIELPGSHSPMASRPRELADVLLA
jgi:hypothetical protein